MTRPGPGISRQARILAAAAWVLCAAACESPRWQASAEPADATLSVDGIARARPTLDERIPYYGVIEVSVAPAPGARPPLFARRTTLAIDEPVTPWLFPFDFFVEMAVAAFVEDPIRQTSVALPQRDDVPEAHSSGADQTRFVERARNAAWER